MEEHYVLGVVFWGTNFGDIFTKICLPSLLTKGNIQSLSNSKQKNKLLICTTDADWKRIQTSEIMKKCNKLIDVRHLKLVGEYSAKNKLKRMSLGHKMIANTMFSEKAIGVFIYPDTVFADGSLEHAQQIIKSGKTVALACCPRFANEVFMEEISKIFQWQSKSHDLKSDPRTLLRLALRNMHSEMLRHEWSQPFISDFLTSPWFGKKENGTIVCHSVCWAPLMLNFGSLKTHNTDTFDTLTIDCDYVYRNFGDPKLVHGVTDSDNACLISFTPESELTFFPFRKMHNQNIPFLKLFAKLSILRRRLGLALKASEIDELKLALFRKPVFFHANSLTKNDLVLGTHSEKIIERAISPETKLERWLEPLSREPFWHFIVLNTIGFRVVNAFRSTTILLFYLLRYAGAKLKKNSKTILGKSKGNS